MSQRGVDKASVSADAEEVVHPAPLRSRLGRAVLRARAFVRGHPRFGVALLAVVVLTAIGLGGGALGGSPPRPVPAEPSPPTAPLSAGERRGPFHVLRVVDGATLVVEEPPGRATTVRLLGIETPGLVDHGLQIHCLVAAATTALRTRVSGRTVDLEVDPSQGDRQLGDRQLGIGSPGEPGAGQVAYVYVDRTLVNQTLLAGGFDTEYADHPYRLQASFRSAEQTARQQGLGVWSPGRCGRG